MGKEEKGGDEKVVGAGIGKQGLLPSQVSPVLGFGTESSPAAASPPIIPLKRIFQERVFVTEACYLCREGHTTLNKLGPNTIFFCNQCERPCHVCCYNKGSAPAMEPLKVLQEYEKFDFLCCRECLLLRGSLYQMLAKGEEKAFPDGDGGENAARWQLFSGRDPRKQVKRLVRRVIEIFQDAFGETAAHDKDIISNMVNAKFLSGTMDFRGMCCAVITVGSVVVSAAILKARKDEVAELVLIATRREWRRKGYFRALLGKIEAKLRDLKVQLLTAPVDPEMQSIWKEKLGFTILSEEQKMSLLVQHPIVMFKNLSLALKLLVDEWRWPGAPTSGAGNLGLNPGSGTGTVTGVIPESSYNSVDLEITLMHTATTPTQPADPSQPADPLESLSKSEEHPQPRRSERPRRRRHDPIYIWD